MQEHSELGCKENNQICMLSSNNVWMMEIRVPHLKVTLKESEMEYQNVDQHVSIYACKPRSRHLMMQYTRTCVCNCTFFCSIGEK